MACCHLRANCQKQVSFSSYLLLLQHFQITKYEHTSDRNLNNINMMIAYNL